MTGRRMFQSSPLRHVSTFSGHASESARDGLVAWGVPSRASSLTNAAKASREGCPSRCRTGDLPGRRTPGAPHHSPCRRLGETNRLFVRPHRVVDVEVEMHLLRRAIGPVRRSVLPAPKAALGAEVGGITAAVGWTVRAFHPSWAPDGRSSPIRDGRLLSSGSRWLSEATDLRSIQRGVVAR